MHILTMEEGTRFAYERELVSGGAEYICGVDEVGRGPLAGPVVCAAVVLPYDDMIEGVNDSKKLSAKKREYLAGLIKKKALAINISVIGPDVIDDINILNATKLCMKKAAEGLSLIPELVLTDGNMTLDTLLPQRSVIKGDQSCYCIGAASIVAKVYRDALMDGEDKLYPAYGFSRNKGYGTAEHIAAIKKYGLCPVHRRSFTAKWV